MSRSTLTACLIIVSLASPSLLEAQENAEAKPQSTEEIIERILELRREMEALLEVLPPELQEEIERRWRELEEAEAARAAAHLPQVESTGRAKAAIVPPAPGPVPETEYVPSPESTARAEIAVVPEAPEEEPEETTASVPGVGPPAATTPIIPQPPAPALPAPEPAPVPVCGTLTPFDSNEDGVLSAADRYWRYFRLKLGGVNRESLGPASLYDLGVRTIEVDLRFYSTADKETGDIDVDENIHLELTGKGRLTGESGVLVIDADRLARGGETRLVDQSGAPLAGFQALRPGQALETAEGSRLPLLCP